MTAAAPSWHPLRAQQHPPERLAALDVRVGLGRLGQREDPVDDDPQLARGGAPSSPSIIVRTRAGSRPISAPRKTPVSDAFFSISGHTSGGDASRPARPTQLIRPRYASARMLVSSVEPPTGSTTRSTPRPSVRSRTAFATSSRA